MALLIAALLAFFCASAPFAHAQEAVPNPETPAPAATPPSTEIKAEIAPGEINPNEIGPIVFTYWERAALNDARNSRSPVRPARKDELKKSGDAEARPEPGTREITLGGISYVSSKDWIIWLNGKRVTPKAIPREVVELHVDKDYVQLKWFDDYTNQIFPVRIRPYQRFNIDKRVFMPGTAQ